MPALFTSTSMRPNSATVASMSAPHSSQSPTWHRTGSARRPNARISSATISHASIFRLATTTSAPASANPNAIARPNALAGPGDDDDLVGRVEVRERHRLPAFRRGVSSDAVDQVPDVDIEQRVGFGGVDAARVASRSYLSRPARWPRSGLDRDEADGRPHQQSARLHGGVGAEAVVSHRVDERPRHLHECLASEREDEPALLRRNELRSQCPGPARGVAVPRLVVDARWRDVRKEAIGDRVDERILVPDPAVQRDRRDAEPGRDAAHAHGVEPRLAKDLDRRGDDLVGVQVEVGLPAHGTITSLPTTRRSARRWSALGSSSNVGVAVTAFRRLPSAMRRDNARWISSSSAGD